MKIKVRISKHKNVGIQLNARLDREIFVSDFRGQKRYIQNESKFYISAK
jgi:hypothetical protein